jgi:hypothetical protein
MGCDDGLKYIDLMEGNPRTILTGSRTVVSKPTLGEHANPEALVSLMGPMGPQE